jgi:inward rectifier potassium channel
MSTGKRPSARRTRRMRFAEREVVRHGLQHRVWQDLYHYCMTISWPLFLASWAGLFIAFNTVFSALYWLSPGCISNLNPPGFLGNFFFSIETLATVGYGDMHPVNTYGHTLAAVEILLGITNIALVTGVMFARFSRPTARFLFATVAVVRPLDGKTVLMFRAANARQNIVMEASARLRLIRDTISVEGYRMRRVEDLALVRSEHPLFVLGWNILHVIDSASPLHGATAASLEAQHATINLTLSGTDETTGQVLMARHAYPSSALRWGHSFRDIITSSDDGLDHFDYTKFNEVDPL